MVKKIVFWDHKGILQGKIMIRNKKGITLVELIISLGIIALVFALIAPLFFAGVEYSGIVNGFVQDQANLRKIMTDLSREIRDATDVTLVSSTEIIVGNSTYAYNADTNEITKYFADTNTTVVVSSRVEYFNITQTDNLIEFEVRADGEESTIVTKVVTRENIQPTPDIA